MEKGIREGEVRFVLCLREREWGGLFLDLGGRMG